MQYIVPDMKLIAQDKDMSCWYASAMMLIDWRRRTKRMTEAAHPDPSQVARWQSLYWDNTGITNDLIKAFARDMGLEVIPPMSPTIEALVSWLRQYGPLWVNGWSHITVIAGIRPSGGETTLLVYDPAKPAKPAGEWRPIRSWYVNDSHSGRDSSNAVQAVFLRLPK